MDGKKLKQELDKRGLKKKFIAEKLNINAANISHWINSNREIPTKHVIEIKSLLAIK